LSKLPDLKRILREDVPDAPDWINKIIYPVNQFFEAVYQGLNKQLTFSENFASTTKTVEVVTTSGYPGTFTALKIPSGLATTAEGVLIAQISLKGSSYDIITTSPFINWVDVNSVININHISGLAASSTYILKLLIF